MKTLFKVIAFLFCVIPVSNLGQSSLNDKETYLSWSEGKAVGIGKEMRVSGKVGSRFAFRGLHTERAVNYKLRATWLTPDVIRASARLEQLRNRLTDDQTRALVDEAERAGDTVVLIEIDPNEGSGVIPEDWRAFLQPKGTKPGTEGAIRGTKAPHLRTAKALSGVLRRDYDYDVFWVVFPLVDENKASLFPDAVSDVELLLGIRDREELVTWRMPKSIRARIKSLSRK
ncbi:MAG: hypothetical protein WAV47_23385 [Blastocatellia bacterium]